MTNTQPAIPESLTDWLSEQGFPVGRLEPLQGDVSSRRYLRLRTSGDRSAVLALYPTDLVTSCQRFVRTNRLLENSGVRVPEIYAVEHGDGWMLLEDLGDETLYSRAGRPWSELQPLVETASGLSERIRAIPIEEVAGLSPPLDAEVLKRELRQTWTECLDPRRLVGDDSASTSLANALDRLCEELGAEDMVVCHRDFMARNLIPLDRGTDLAVIDHQDLRPGPATYDLASLLNDSLFAPGNVEKQILDRYGMGAAETVGYHRAAAQRTLKAAGTFAVFAQRGNPRHVPLITPSLLRAQQHLRRVPECIDAIAGLATRWASLLQDPVA